MHKYLQEENICSADLLKLHNSLVLVKDVQLPLLLSIRILGF